MRQPHLWTSALSSQISDVTWWLGENCFFCLAPEAGQVQWKPVWGGSFTTLKCHSRELAVSSTYTLLNTSGSIHNRGSGKVLSWWASLSMYLKSHIEVVVQNIHCLALIHPISLFWGCARFCLTWKARIWYNNASFFHVCEKFTVRKYAVLHYQPGPDEFQLSLNKQWQKYFWHF